MSNCTDCIPQIPDPCKGKRTWTSCVLSQNPIPSLGVQANETLNITLEKIGVLISNSGGGSTSILNWEEGFYVTNSLVFHNGAIWRAETPTEEEPSNESEDWLKLAEINVELLWENIYGDQSSINLSDFNNNGDGNSPFATMDDLPNGDYTPVEAPVNTLFLGKPIYKITFSGTDDDNIDVSSLNIEEVVNIEGQFKTSWIYWGSEVKSFNCNNILFPVPGAELYLRSSVIYNFTNKEIEINLESGEIGGGSVNPPSYDWHITVYYTKT